jgi:8-amino-7-oxononanoate synthase
MNNNPYAWINESLATIYRANWYRSVQTIHSQPGATVVLSGQEVINFASNDYLGLAGDERLQIAAINAIQKFGTGSTGSRLLSGHREIHRELEQGIASTKQTEDALVFSSGYLANLGTIAAIVGKRDLILSDQYNHSSLKKGAILSGATVMEYPHGGTAVLQEKLWEHRKKYRRCLIITDSVFSMDGDLCPLPQLLDLAEEFSSMLLLDEAHATGVMGKTGAGCVEHFGCTGRELIQIGTLSKALGSLGGYVAGSSSLIDFLRNRAPSWIYTTALSPADTAAAIAAIQVIQQEPERLQNLWSNVQYFQTHLASIAYKLLPSHSPILCLELDSTEQALALAQQLQNQGIFAPAIRPPTGPTSRLRFTAMATHSLAHLEVLVQSIGESFPT